MYRGNAVFEFVTLTVLCRLQFRNDQMISSTEPTVYYNSSYGTGRFPA